MGCGLRHSLSRSFTTLWLVARIFARSTICSEGLCSAEWLLLARDGAFEAWPQGAEAPVAAGPPLPGDRGCWILWLLVCTSSSPWGSCPMLLRGVAMMHTEALRSRYKFSDCT